MNKNQKHLDPDTVLWFMQRGVEFGDIDCMWERYAEKTLHVFGRGFKNEYRLVLSRRCSDVIESIPAPHLQEVLEVLPKYISSTSYSVKMPLSVQWCDVTERW